jgi:hypothetical protein
MIKERRPFTDLEAKRVRALAKARFLPGSPFKRFVADMLAELNARAPRGLTEGQAEQLAHTAWRYRAQLPDDVVPATNPNLKLEGDKNGK